MILNSMELLASKNVTAKRNSSIGKLLTAQSARLDSIRTSQIRSASHALIRTAMIVSLRDINTDYSAKKNALLARKISGLILKCACAGLNAIKPLFSIFIPKDVNQ
jgi:hypothetical protein